MASSGNFRIATPLALIGGVVGVGIIIYALMQGRLGQQMMTDEPVVASSVASAPEVEAPVSNETPKVEAPAPAAQNEVVEADTSVTSDQGHEPAPAATDTPEELTQEAVAAVDDVAPDEIVADVVESAAEGVADNSNADEAPELLEIAPDIALGSDQDDSAEQTDDVAQEGTVETEETPSEAEVAVVEDDGVGEPSAEDTVVASVEVQTPEQPAPTVDGANTADEAEEEAATPVVVTTVPEGSDEAPELDANDPSVPQFDLVRVEADGSAVIAGRAEPNAEVKILSNGEEIGTATASSRGEFVALVETEISQTAQSLALLAVNPSGPTVASRSSVIVLGRDMTTNANGTQEIVSLPPAIVQATPDAVRVIQPVVGLADLDRVSLDSISYDAESQIILAGRGRPNNLARVYADSTLVAEVEISNSGTWSATVNDLDAGRYVLRVDEIGADDAVLSRVESPFQRVFPTAERLALLESDQQVIVQPGNNLWTIAEIKYGKGFRYTVIFEANKEQIRDPDLIYPGQVFALPEDAAQE